MELTAIVNEIVEGIRPTSGIFSITDNLNGYYTITVVKLDNLLVNNQFVSISGTAGFDTDSTEVFNINYTLKTFDIQLPTGQAISTLGIFTAKAPFFDFTDTILEYSNNLTLEQQKSFRKDIEMFPAIYMQTGFQENDKENDTDFEVNELRLLFINFTEIDNNTEGRYQDDIPYLMNLYTKFKREMRRHTKLNSVQGFAHEKNTFAEFQTNEAVSQVIATVSLTYSTNEC